jgi:hypothetical protein
MRAPDTKGDGIWFGKFIGVCSFSEADWREIKASLAEHDIDLDMRVGGFVPGKSRWWLLDDSATGTKPGHPRPLRDALWCMALYYGTLVPHVWNKPPTPIQQAKGLQKMLSVFENTLLALNMNGMFDRPGWTDDDARAADKMLFDATALYITRLQERITKLRTMPSPRVENARTAHNDYWHELTRLWVGIGGGVGPKRDSLRNFLLACSRAPFPHMTAQELNNKVDSFIDNRSRKKPPRPLKS